MNGYQTWTYSPELGKTDRLRGVDQIPKFLTKKYALTGRGLSFRVLRQGTGHQPRLFLYLPEGGPIQAAGFPGRPARLHDFSLFGKRSQADPGTGLRRHPAPRGPYAISTFSGRRDGGCLYDGWFDAMRSSPGQKKSWRAIPAGTITIRTSPIWAWRQTSRPAGSTCGRGPFQIDDGWEWKVGTG